MENIVSCVAAQKTHSATTNRRGAVLFSLQSHKPSRAERIKRGDDGLHDLVYLVFVIKEH